MTSQTLGRRNTAPVQSTELDLSSQMFVCFQNERYLVHLEETVRKRVVISFSSRVSEGGDPGKPPVAPDGSAPL
jgi:hypothetical protein